MYYIAKTFMDIKYNDLIEFRSRQETEVVPSRRAPVMSP